MKKFKKLIPAFCMLLISAMLMGTSTYAWFSMNKTVTATGMELKAKSDSIYLVINAGADFDKTNTKAEATSQIDAAKELYPVAPVETLTSATVATPGAWHYTYSDANDKYEKGADKAYTVCTGDNFANYVASESFSIGLNEKSGAAEAKNLKVTAVKLPENTGISVVIVCGEKAFTYTADKNSGTDVIADTVTDAGVEVKVYYFINGEDEHVYSDNAAALKGTVTLTFDVD